MSDTDDRESADDRIARLVREMHARKRARRRERVQLADPLISPPAMPPEPAEIEAPEASEAVAALRHDMTRYAALPDREIAAELAKLHDGLLLRGSLQALLARREIGGVLIEVARRNPGDRDRFEWLVLKYLDVNYSTGRLHVQLWVHWPFVLVTLERLQFEAQRRHVPFKVPGLRRLLREAGVIEQRQRLALDLKPERVLPAHLPDDVAQLKAIIRAQMADNRELRGVIAKLRGDLQYSDLRRSLLAKDIAGLRATIARYRRRDRHSTDADTR
jgi:hypothetical protein